MTGRLQDQVVLITGGNSGIGRATAQLFIQEGAQIVIAARDAEKASAVLTEFGDAARFMPCDVRQPEDCQQAVDFTLAEFGQIDILVNNSGTGGSEKPILKMTDQDWQSVIDTNLTGVFTLSRAVVETMVDTADY